MRRFFADAFYWIALLSPRDQWHERVLAFAATLDVYHLYTTDEVLTEFLAFYSTASATVRTQAVAFVRAMLDDEDITVIPQTRAGFLHALDLYAAIPALSQRSYTTYAGGLSRSLFQLSEVMFDTPFNA